MMAISYRGHTIDYDGKGDVWWCWITMWWLIGYEESERKAREPVASHPYRVEDFSKFCDGCGGERTFVLPLFELGNQEPVAHLCEVCGFRAPMRQS